MLQRFIVLSRSAGTPLGIVLGIPLGILMGMPYNIWLMVIFGWVLTPLRFFQIISGDRSLLSPFGSEGLQWPEWVLWGYRGAVLWDLLFLFGSGWCAYQAIRHTDSKGERVLYALWLAPVTLMSAIIPSTLTSLLMDGSPLSSLFFYWNGTLTTCAFLLLPFAGIALIGGLAGAELGRRFPPHTPGSGADG